MLEEYMKRLVDEHGFSVAKDEETYQVEINDDISVTITDLDPGAVFFSKLTPLLKDHREELFTYLMRANLLGKGTFDSVVGLDSDEKFLTLSRSMAYEIDYPTFKEVLEVFANSLQMLREEVAKKYEEAKQSIY